MTSVYWGGGLCGSSWWLSTWELVDQMDASLSGLRGLMEAVNPMGTRDEPSKHDHRFGVLSCKYLRKVLTCQPYYSSKWHMRLSALHCQRKINWEIQKPLSKTSRNKKEIRKIQEVQAFKERFVVLLWFACSVSLFHQNCVGTKKRFYKYRVQNSNSQSGSGGIHL